MSHHPAWMNAPRAARCDSASPQVTHRDSKGDSPRMHRRPRPTATLSRSARLRLPDVAYFVSRREMCAPTRFRVGAHIP